jgi:iron complex transport system permease protein
MTSVMLIILPIITAILCIGLGRYSLNFAESFDVLYKGLIYGPTSVDPQAYSVVFNIRLPRILLAILCGSGLAASGAAFQGIFANPLATPDTLGVASGAGFGAALALLFGFSMLGVQCVALAFGLMAVALTYNFSKIRGKASIVMVVLAGIVISALFEAFISLIKYVADPEEQLPTITYWLMGSLASVSYESLAVGAPLVLVGLVVIYSLRWKLNILSLNEDEASSMGINVKIMRIAVIVSAALITGSCVSMSGQIAWVGLLIPHVSRMIFGSNNRFLVPASISLGAVFMLIIDTVARTATAAEIPISILTAVIGAPVFILLLRRTGGAWA